MPDGPKYPDIFVQLSGEDSNMGAIMGRVVSALKQAGAPADEIRNFRMSIFDASSFDDALNRVAEWVDVA